MTSCTERAHRPRLDVSPCKNRQLSHIGGEVCHDAVCRHSLSEGGLQINVLYIYVGTPLRAKSLGYGVLVGLVTPQRWL